MISVQPYSVKPAEARKVARDFFNQGFKRQKWFLMSGPAGGAEGLKQNIELAQALREELGPDAMLMFDGIQYVWKSAVIQSRVSFQHCQTRPLVAEAGTFAMAEEAGLGPSLDEARLERVQM